MKSVLRHAMGLIAAAAMVTFTAGCGDDSSSDGGGGNPPPFDGASDALDGNFIGQVTAEGQSSGLVMKIDQNKHLVYGPIEIGSMVGTFKGSFSGNDISFKADVTGGGKSGTYNFKGQITDGGDTLTGTFTAVVGGQARSGSWSAQR